MYIDHIEVSCEGDQQNAPTGAPSSDSSSETDAPTESVVMFVKKIKGKKLKKDQDDGTELAVSILKNTSALTCACFFFFADVCCMQCTVCALFAYSYAKAQ